MEIPPRGVKTVSYTHLTCSSDTILRAIKELTQDNISYTSDTGKTYDFNTADKLNTLPVSYTHQMCIRDRPKTGTIELTEQLAAALKDLQKNLPADVHVSTDIFRQSRFIESSIGNVKLSLIHILSFLTM